MFFVCCTLLFYLLRVPRRTSARGACSCARFVPFFPCFIFGCFVTRTLRKKKTSRNQPSCFRPVVSCVWCDMCEKCVSSLCLSPQSRSREYVARIPTIPHACKAVLLFYTLCTPHSRILLIDEHVDEYTKLHSGPRLFKRPLPTPCVLLYCMPRRGGTAQFLGWASALSCPADLVTSHHTRSKFGLTPGCAPCATAEPHSYLARSKLCAGCSRRATRAKSAMARPS